MQTTALHGFADLRAFADAVEQRNVLPNNVAELATSVRMQLASSGYVAFDDSTKSWTLTQRGVDFIANDRKQHSKQYGPFSSVPSLLYGFLFGYYNAADPTLEVVEKQLTDTDPYHSYYLLLSSKYHPVDDAVTANKVVTHTAEDHRSLVADVFNFDEKAREYRALCLARAYNSATEQLPALFEGFVYTVDDGGDPLDCRSDLFEGDLLHVVLGILIAAAL
jgi:hypothetical protein